MTAVDSEFRDYRTASGMPPSDDVVPEVSVVVPVYFNEGSLAILYDRIAATMASARVDAWEIVLVDDGSGDSSRTVLEALRRQHTNVIVVHMSRNFGSFAATTAGLRYARGKCVAVISADLQDPPELLQQMVDHWRSGIKVVVANRNSREDPWTSRIFSACFWWLYRRMVSADMPPGGFDFFVIDAQVADILLTTGEKNTTLFATLNWLGFPRVVLPYHRAVRPFGTSRWTFWRKFKLMYDAILSFSYVPIRMMTALGMLGLVLSFGYATWTVIHRFTSHEVPPGYASLMVVTLFFNGLTLTSVGVVGEYVWRSFDAARKRPYFVIDKWSSSPKRTALSAGDGTIRPSEAVDGSTPAAVISEPSVGADSTPNSKRRESHA